MNRHFPLKFSTLLYVLQLLFNVGGSKRARSSGTAGSAHGDKDDKLLAKSESAVTTSDDTEDDLKTFRQRSKARFGGLIIKPVFYMAH